MKLLFSHILKLSCVGAVLLAFLTLPVRAEETAAAPEVVWVKADRTAFETQGVVGDGTEANPFNTIQKGVDTVAVGGTVKIMAGTYDYDEQFDGAHTNRVIINKRVILDGVDGKDATHIAGKLAAGDVGCGPDAIRCIKISSSSVVNGSVIKNLTLRNGGGPANGSGGAINASDNRNRPLYVVDCVVSNSASNIGGGLCGVWAIRCKIDNCRSYSFGAGIDYCRLAHCLITNCKKYKGTTTSNRPVVIRSYAVNCTLVGGDKSNTEGFGRAAYVYNSIVVQTTCGDMVTSGSYPVSEVKNCYTDNDNNDIRPFVNMEKKDYRLNLETSSIGGGRTAFISDFLKVSGNMETPPDGLALNVDLAGNEIDMTKETCDIGCYQRPLHWYVDAKDGEDSNSGSLPYFPMKTLAAIMDKTLPGDTVHAAAGTYDEGYMTASTSAGYDMRNRVKIPSGVTLVADEGKEKTFIVGAADATESGDKYRMGTNAVRCVYLSANSRIKDFTITGGYTWGEKIPDDCGASDPTNKGNWSGGGVFGEASGIVDGCMISNNWARYGGAMRTVTAVRSLIFENHALDQGGAMRGSFFYGCVVDRNYTGFKSGTNPSACYKHSAIVGCTLGANNYTHDGGSNGKCFTSEVASPVFRYNTIMGSIGNPNGDASAKLIGCVFANGIGNWGSRCENCIYNAKNAIKLDENYRPLPDSIGVDLVTAEQLSSATGGKLPVDKDLSGFQRVMNGKADVGALEADWRKEYAKRLAGNSRHIKVEYAAPGVVTNEVVGVSSLSLHGGDALEFVWCDDFPKAKRNGFVSVFGDGTLTLKRNGEVYAEFTAAASPVEFAVSSEGNGECKFEFAFAGEGSADIYGLSVVKGLVVTVR